MRQIIFIIILLSILLFASAQEVQDSSFSPQITIEGRVVFQSDIDGDNEIYMIAGGKVIKLTDNDWEDQYPVFSPDGSRIAFLSAPEGQFDVFVMDDRGEEIKALTSFEGDEETPAWFADGKRVAFTRNIKQIAGKKQHLYSVDITNGSTEKIIPRYKKNHSIPHFSPKADLLTFTAKRMFGWDVAVCDLSEFSIRFLDEGGKSCRARFSKDGKKLAYVSTRADGKGDIWLMKPDGSDKTRLTLRDQTHDYFPSWSPDGTQIVFSSSLEHDIESDWQILVYDLKTGKTAVLFDSPGSDIFPDWHK